MSTLLKRSKLWSCPFRPILPFRSFYGAGEKVKKTTVNTIQSIADKKERKITMVTSYDYPSAVHLSQAGIDISLVGDSLGMVMLGYDTTQPVTVDEMLHHCRAVKRGTKGPLIVGDMPFGSYETSPIQAMQTAFRFVKEGFVDAVKLEGGNNRKDHIRSIVDGGIAVMGHIGLNPQSISALGYFKAQGRTAEQAEMLVEDALSIQDAGAFACVIECVPPIVAQKVSEMISIPLIGIGAGPYVDGQVLVYHDMLGLLQHPHHRNVAPKFCKIFADAHFEVMKGLKRFKVDAEKGVFPGPEHSPYAMLPNEEEMFLGVLSGKYGKCGSDGKNDSKR